MQPSCAPEQLIGHRTIITGEVNTGKTTLTGFWGDAVWKCLDAPFVTVLDMAPTMPPKLCGRIRNRGIGGFVGFSSFTPDLLFRGAVHPPRLLGTSPDHILALARENKKRIETWLTAVLARDQVDLLIINDMSIYLQTGKVEKLTDVIHHARTVIANGYQGTTLGADALSQAESQAMDRITRIFQHQVRLTKILT
jgi:hypothetical protein